jgi:polyisoprenoid-binding protein YceI
MYTKRRAVALIVPALMAAIAARCSPGDTDAATVIRPSAATSADASVSATAPALAGLHLTVAPTGNEARYRIREQLVRVDLPGEAIGKTTEITGGIGIGPDGRIIPAESKFVVNVGPLKSDRDMRDGYVRRRVLETDQYPTVEFTPTGFSGLPKALPTDGSHTFDVIGNLTVHGVTKPTTWRVKAEAKNGRVTGNASTLFTFSDFNLPQPRVPVLLSVEDTIRLEYDFSLVPRS